VILDNVALYVKAGNGGNGGNSLQRKNNVPVGSGGEGGRGGDVIARVNENLYDLSKLKYTRKFLAPDGNRGGTQQKDGKDAESLIIAVPAGTIVYDEQGKFLCDLTVYGQEYCLVRGGQGGQGNFKRAAAEEGCLGEEKKVIFDYRIPNDVAFLGVANTGKTSLVNYISGQNYKVAEYPFTTTGCVWAVCEHSFRNFTVLDNPPISEREELKETFFLKHLLRSRIIAVISDNPDTCNQERDFIISKLKKFDPKFLKKIFFYLLTKIDTIEEDSKIDGWRGVSAQTGAGVGEFLEDILLTLLNDGKENNS
jgi:GTPase